MVYDGKESGMSFDPPSSRRGSASSSRERHTEVKTVASALSVAEPSSGAAIIQQSPTLQALLRVVLLLMLFLGFQLELVLDSESQSDLLEPMLEC